jgi:hypothetical protein
MRGGRGFLGQQRWHDLGVDVVARACVGGGGRLDQGCHLLGVGDDGGACGGLQRGLHDGSSSGEVDNFCDLAV